MSTTGESRSPARLVESSLQENAYLPIHWPYIQSSFPFSSRPTQGRANSDSLGWFCGTTSRCVPRGVRPPLASSYPQRHHASTRSSVSELGPHSLSLGRGRVSPGAATSSPSRRVPKRAGHLEHGQDSAAKGTPPTGDRAWSEEA